MHVTQRVVLMLKLKHAKTLKMSHLFSDLANKSHLFGVLSTKARGSNYIRKEHSMQESNFRYAQLWQVLPIFKPDITSLGYALFLATNATIIWGGIFPFLPLDIQDDTVTSTFFIAQALSFALGFFISLFWAMFRTNETDLERKITFMLPSVPYALGWGCLISIIYTNETHFFLVISAGALMGFATSFYMTFWFKIFASLQRKFSIEVTTKGLFYTPVIYLLLQLMPNVFNAFLVPLVCMPLFTIALIASLKKSHFNQTMFKTPYRGNEKEHVTCIKDYWRVALGMASISFCCGAMRSLAISDASVGLFVNSMSMIGALLSGAVLFFFWYFRPIRFNLLSFFRMCFPVLIVAFALFPFIKKIAGIYYPLLAGFLYAFYTAAFALVIIQCIQAARSRHIHPNFIFGFFGGIIYFAHDAGFIMELAPNGISFSTEEQTNVLALCLVAVLAIVFFICQGEFSTVSNPNRVNAEHIELIQTAVSPEARMRDSAGDAHGLKVEGDDEISKSCASIAMHYALSNREREIMELIIRGNTIKRISEELLLSENTVKTYTKRIYSKLGIHKKQQLRDLVSSV